MVINLPYSISDQQNQEKEKNAINTINFLLYFKNMRTTFPKSGYYVSKPYNSQNVFKNEVFCCRFREGVDQVGRCSELKVTRQY